MVATPSHERAVDIVVGKDRNEIYQGAGEMYAAAWPLCHPQARNYNTFNTAPFRNWQKTQEQHLPHSRSAVNTGNALATLYI